MKLEFNKVESVDAVREFRKINPKKFVQDFSTAIGGFLTIDGDLSDRYNYAIRHAHRGAYIEKIDFNLDACKDSALRKIIDSMTAAGFPVRRTSKNHLWVSSPYEFDLLLNGYPVDDSAWAYLGELKGPPETKRWCHTIPEFPYLIQQEFPISLGGFVTYEPISKIKPEPVIDLLSGLGYGVKVIPTPAHIEEVLRQLESRRNPRTLDSMFDPASGIV